MNTLHLCTINTTVNRTEREGFGAFGELEPAVRPTAGVSEVLLTGRTGEAGIE